MASSYSLNQHRPLARLKRFSRGNIAAHLLGLAFLFQFVLERAFTFESIPFTSLIQIPMRLIAIWLILDRVGRKGRFKIRTWDYIHLVFMAVFGIILVYADLKMNRPTGLGNYVSWISNFFYAYTWGLLVREAALRPGFSFNILTRWMLITFTVLCVIALSQALNVAGARGLIDRFYHQREAELHMEGPSEPWQARGASPHANSLAILLLTGFGVVIARFSLKKFDWFDWTAGVLMVATIFATYSRTGMVGLFAIAIAVVITLVREKKIYASMVSLFVLFSLTALFAGAVFAFNIKRYKILVEGEGQVKNLAANQVGSWYLRGKTINKAIEKSKQYPLTGIEAASQVVNNVRVISRDPYSVEGMLLNIYVFAFLSYGIWGLLFIGGLYACLFAQLITVRHKMSRALFVMGVMLAVTGISENVLFTTQVMTIINILMAAQLHLAPRRVIARRRAFAEPVAPTVTA